MQDLHVKGSLERPVVVLSGRIVQFDCGYSQLLGTVYRNRGWYGDTLKGQCTEIES